MEYQYRNLAHIADYLEGQAKHELSMIEEKLPRNKKAELRRERAAVYQSIAAMLRNTRLTEQTITYRRA